SLLARLEQSKTLPDFVANELATERAALLQSHRDRAIRRIAFAAVHQTLIPFDLLKTLKIEEVSKLLKAEDPFSLLFGFELCRDKLKDDARFLEAGTAFLKKLFEGDQSLNRLNVFSACALIATPHIRRAANARSAPVFWARLAALTHAGVLAD